MSWTDCPHQATWSQCGREHSFRYMYMHMYMCQYSHMDMYGSYYGIRPIVVLHV